MTSTITQSLLLFSLLALSSCEKQQTPPEPPRRVLSIVATATAASTLSLPGTVEARTKTELGFRVLGRMIARHVSVGDIIKKDEIVAEIDPLSLQLAVRSAESELANSQAQLVNASAIEGRQRLLLQSRSGSEAALEQAVQGKRSAVASVAKAQANLDKVKEQLSYADLRAEFDGVVTVTSAEVGQVVSAGESIVTIAKPEERDAVIDIPEATFDGLKPGSPFEVMLQLDPTIRASGVVREIAPEAEPTTRTIRTKITLLNPPTSFRLGSVVTASATIVAEPSVFLPASAILMKDARPNVWLVDTGSGTVSLHAVTLDGRPSDANTVRVIEGINPGDRVVVAGVHKLSEGQTVRADQGGNP